MTYFHVIGGKYIGCRNTGNITVGAICKSSVLAYEAMNPSFDSNEPLANFKPNSLSA